MSKLETNTIDTVSGTSNLTIGSTNTSTITMPNGKLTGQSYPSFEANLSGDTTISDVTATLVPFNVVVFDTDSCYSTSTYKFTPNVAGKYYVYCSVMSDALGGTDLRRTSARIYKNDAHYKSVQWLQESNRARQQNPYVVGIIDMNGTTDNLSIYAYIDDNSGSPKLETGVRSNTFGAFRLGA